MEGSRWQGLRTEEVTPYGNGKENSTQATCQGCSHTFFQRGKKWFVFQNILKVFFCKTPNCVIFKTIPPEKACWNGLCSKTVVCKIVWGHLPFLLIRKIENQKLSFSLQRSYLLLAVASSSCQETRRRELAVLSLCWKSCLHSAISNSVTHDWGDAIQ